MERIHELRIYPEDFEQVLNGSKPFVVIENDKKYRAGDTVLMREWNNQCCSGKEIHGTILSVTDDWTPGIEKGYAVIFIRIFRVIV